jgi:hypothetical protein
LRNVSTASVAVPRQALNFQVPSRCAVRECCRPNLAAVFTAILEDIKT